LQYKQKTLPVSAHSSHGAWVVSFDDLKPLNLEWRTQCQPASQCLRGSSSTGVLARFSLAGFFLAGIFLAGILFSKMVDHPHHAGKKVPITITIPTWIPFNSIR
jgi:hypothetical protein